VRILDNKIIEGVLKDIVDIDKETVEEISKTKIKIEQREKQLQSNLRKKQKEFEEARMKKGREIYQSLIEQAEEEKEQVLSKCFVHTNELDNLLEKNKKELRDKVFEKLMLI
jgi:outer membrane translocation and assembly module TamA